MEDYSVANDGYPVSFTTPLEIDVTEDPKFRLKVAVRAELKPGTPFQVSLDEAIQCAERHMFIQNKDGTKDENPTPTVRDWVNILRWEMGTYWATTPTKHYHLRSDNVIHFTHEHYRRSGELLAEGLAIRLLEERLKIKRQHFYFYRSGDVRPDFAVNLKGKRKLATILGNQRIGLECRSRKGQDSLNKKDTKDIEKKKKKSGFTYVLIAYCFYGKGKHRSGTLRTRIHLADPNGDDTLPVTEDDLGAIAVQHYLGVVSRIGLWKFRDHLLKAGRAYSRMQRFADTIPDDMPGYASKLPHGDREYRGRWFSSLVRFAFSPCRTAAEKQNLQAIVRHRWEQRDYGTIYYMGLDRSVFSMIARNDWHSLSGFSGQTVSETSENGFTALGSDGVIRHEFRLHPDSEWFDQVRRQLSTALGS
ncbi:MAG: hypothetical protein ABSE73_01150 [Planctomycetota bacterium]